MSETDAELRTRLYRAVTGGEHPGVTSFTWAELVAETEQRIARLTKWWADAQKHNCRDWELEGICCSQCNPTAIALRELWDKDPVRAERDRAVALLVEYTQIEHVDDGGAFDANVRAFLSARGFERGED